MKPLFSTPADFAKLKAEAATWLGTPYCGDGSIKGAGVSCSLLPYEILRACGSGLPRPPARREMPKVSAYRFAESWLTEAAAHFAKISSEQMGAGDLALIDAGMGHLLLMIDANDFIHCWRTAGVHLVNVNSPKIAARIRSVWRPII